MKTKIIITIIILFAAGMGGIQLFMKKDQPISTHESPLENDRTKTDSSLTPKTALTPSLVTHKEVQTDSKCYRHTFQHAERNKNRDLEDFMNDTNAFPILESAVNDLSICVKVNHKPVQHRLIKKGNRREVMIGSVVGPESKIQISYCTGAKSQCRESCEVKAINKVDELLNDQELGSIENEELKNRAKELIRVTQMQGDLLDSTLIREWKEIGSNDWICKK